MSKLDFNIVEIPEGESSRVIGLSDEDLDVSPHDFKGGAIEVDFYRTLHFIRTNFHIDSDIQLICDRSLDPFTKSIEADFQVVFKVDVQEETEDEHGAVRSFNFSSNTLSIEDEVRDTIMLNVPIKKLHPRFLDEHGNPEKFKEEAFGDIADEEAIDPRWEKLKKLKNQ